ncbi:MAG: hypothetical protein ACYDD1_04475 [Caulobacteraceae bacterium]
MWPSLKPSQRVAVAAAIDPQSANAVVYSPWVSAANFHKVMAVVQAGALGAAATVDAKFQQAQDGAGTGVKDVTTTVMTTLTKTGTDNSSTQSMINCKMSELDINNGFCFVRLAVTPAVAASLIAALVLGVDQHQGFASDSNAASVLQVMN